MTKHGRFPSLPPCCWALVLLVTVAWFVIVWSQSQSQWVSSTSTMATKRITKIQPPRFEIVVTMLHDPKQNTKRPELEDGSWLMLPEVRDIPVTICSPDRLRKNPGYFRPEDAFSNLFNSNRTGKITILPIVNGVLAAEVPGYLASILHHWESLPDVMIFLHAHPEAHNPDIIRDIGWVVAGDELNNISKWTLEQIGFLSLNESPVVCRKGSSGAWKEQWEMLGFDPRVLPGRVKTPCCAQFMVTKERIQLRPRWFYQQALKVAYELQDPHFFEHFWHIFWGEPAILTEDRELRTYARSNWTKPVREAVLQNPYINHAPLYLSETMMPWYETYQANPDSYYPIFNESTGVCPPGPLYCVDMKCPEGA